MIYLYSGTPGSGKSLHVAKDLSAWLRSGSPAICNFDFNISNVCSPKKCGEFYYINNSILRPELLIKYARLYFKNHKFQEGAIRLYVDEAQLLYNSRDWNSAGRREWLSFFTQHRKFGYDVFLVSQFDKMLDKQLRALIEYEVIHRKVKNFGFKGAVIDYFAFGSLFSAVKIWYPLRERIEGYFFKGTQKLYNLYNTLDNFDTF